MAAAADPKLVDEMLDRLCRTLEVAPEEFRRDFDLTALQRNLKDLGTFGFMVTMRDRPEYLDYVPRTIRYITSTLIRSRRYHVFYPLVERYLLRD